MTIFGASLGPPDVREPVIISALEFDVLWEHLGLPEMPIVLRVPSPGRTHPERTQLVQSAWNSLQAKGYGRSVDLGPRIITLLSTLARPDSEVDGRLWMDREIRLLTAVRDDIAVLATLISGEIMLREVAPSGLPREALSVLSPKAAGPGSSVTLPTRSFEEAARQGRTPSTFEAALRERGIRVEDAKQLHEMIGDLIAQGQFGAAARDKWGARHRTGHVVSFFDTTGGRYVQIRRPSTGGELWSTISPADSRRLLQHVDAMYRETTAAVSA